MDAGGCIAGEMTPLRGRSPSAGRGRTMKVLLVSANTERMNILPLPLGLACVGAACRRVGHEVMMLNLMFEEDTKSASPLHN